MLPLKHSILWPIRKFCHQDVGLVKVCQHTDNKPSHNIPCDLYIEHVNKILKDCLFMPKNAICQVSQSKGPVDNIIMMSARKRLDVVATKDPI